MLCQRSVCLGSYNTRHKSLKQKPFFLNFLQIFYIHSSHLCSHSDVLLSFPNVERRVFWSTERDDCNTHDQHCGRTKSHKCFKIGDEYCSLRMQPSILAFVASKKNKVRPLFPVTPRGFLLVLQISMRSGTQEQVTTISKDGFLLDKLH